MLMDRLNSGGRFRSIAMDYSEDMNSAATGGDFGIRAGVRAQQSDPLLKKMVVGMNGVPL